MNFTGRIVGLTLTLLSRAAWIIYHDYQGYPYIVDILTIPFYVAVAWWLGKQYDKVKYLSQKDALTGVYNRRFVDDYLPKLMAQVDRKNDVLGLSMIDINNFKAINDSYGHKMGDRVLKEVIRLLNQNTRKGDFIVRWGGDEFLFVSPLERDDSLKIVFMRLEDKFKQLSEQVGFEVSVSIGTAIYPHDGHDFDDLLKVADKKMYNMKSNKDKDDIENFDS
jgi:diguanylate cyclase (GGDEF)-like protein